MKVVIRYYRQNDKFEADYAHMYKKTIKGENAKECMEKINHLKYHHDCFKYTPISIIDIID